ncbi:Mg-dependent acid phosphatase [Sporobolomyces salmoneus]|uniref:Mg-dependent acid phosphatase n=1 Tax=Sporobolomyces salmoneus TaxID=183962 RepID=UPI00316FA4CC
MNPDNSTKRMPKCVVFDLDYTLWDLWVDTHVTPPLKRRGKDDVNQIYDKHGQKMAFYPQVPGILMDLHRSKIHIAAASRTHAPKAARQALTELLIPGSIDSDDLLKGGKAKIDKELVSSINLFDSMEIYPGSKITHFQELHKKTGIPYEEMVFFDDESRNREVTNLGVTFVLVGNGVNRALFESGLESWRKGLAK